MALDTLQPTTPQPAPGSEADVDVVICGGGFAGLTMARQLMREHEGLSVAVIDRLARPLPEAAFKVGESTVELAAYYLRDMLGLADYLDGAHIRKLGLRVFFPAETGGDFAARPEYGLSDFATHPTHQIDRGRFETDLRAIVEEDGVRMIEGARITDMTVGEGGALHAVSYVLEEGGRDSAAPEGAAPGAPGTEARTLTARWLVDATGRRRVLQRQLGLSKRREDDHNAAWFRVEGRVDVDDFVPASNAAWHDRVPGKKRYFSTNHLMNEGYWVWLIPLSSGMTSIGIVADRKHHPLEKFQTRKLALEWLAENEPDLAKALEGREIADFGAIKNYSHTSSKVFSADRWACTGDAGVFADPMYSPGADLIAFANTCISWMVGEEREGRLTEEIAEEKSRFVISIGELLTRSIQVNYGLMGSAQALGGKLFWDITAGWAVVQPLMYGKVFLDSEKHKQVRAASRQFFFLSLQMNQLFTDWERMSKGNVSFDFIDYFKVDAIRNMRSRNLVAGKDLETQVADQEENMRLMEELAIALFRVAVADCLPEHAERIEGRWLNAWSVSLDPSTWEERGLLTPRTEPRDTEAMTAQLKAMFRVRELETA